MKLQRSLSVLFVLSLLIMTAAVAPAQAQGEMPPLPGTLVVGELNAPRGVAFGEDGTLYVAVAGSGGEQEVEMPSPEGTSKMKIGLTGVILAVGADGKATPVIGGFPSYASEQETVGVYRAIPHGGSLWVLFTGTGPVTVGAFWTDSIVEINPKTLAVKRVINLNDFEAQNDPDGNGYDSNVADIAWGADGTMYIADAGGNDLLSWTEKDGLKVVAAWKDNPVPTSVEVAANGDLYVGFLGTALAPMAGKVEHWSGGKLANTYSGLTTVTDILLDGDTLYAVEMINFKDNAPGPGRVITLDDKGATAVAEGLIAPFGIAKGPDGALYVSYGTVAFAPGMTGGVVKLDKK